MHVLFLVNQAHIDIRPDPLLVHEEFFDALNADGGSRPVACIGSNVCPAKIYAQFEIQCINLSMYTSNIYIYIYIYTYIYM